MLPCLDVRFSSAVTISIFSHTFVGWQEDEQRTNEKSCGLTVEDIQGLYYYVGSCMFRKENIYLRQYLNLYIY